MPVIGMTIRNLVGGFWKGGLFAFLFLLMSLSAWAQDRVLVLRPPNDEFQVVAKSMENELGEEFQVESFILEDRLPSMEELDELLKQKKPKLIVLMDKKAMDLYAAYQTFKKLPDEQFPPSLVLMTIYSERLINQLKNAVGITYETQGVTGLTILRSLFPDQNIKRVGVLYHDRLKYFIEKQKEQCAKEEIELVGIEISYSGPAPMPFDPVNMPADARKKLERDIRSNLKKLTRGDTVDAIWIPNDSKIVNNYMVNKAWFPILKSTRKPVVAGVETLAEVGLGQIAAFPDPIDLGLQAAGMIFEIKDQSWSLSGMEVKAPVGVFKTLNYKSLPRVLRRQIDDEAMLEFDRIIK